MYHREHIARFLAIIKVSDAESEGIKQRVEIAIAEFGDPVEGMFSGSKLGEVLGHLGLVDRFEKAWESWRIRD